MENIYCKTEAERNSIVELPEGFAEKSGNTLYMWLGSLWRDIHKGDGMIRGLQAARGVRMAQMCLDILEAAKLKDRNGAPVFHRELWHPIAVRLSMRNNAQENMLSTNSGVCAGPQPEGSVYGEGEVMSMGRMANFKDYVTYPLECDVAGGALSIVDNIINPSVLMERGAGKDFEIKNGSIIFPRENDPLADGSPFERYDVPGVVDESGNETSDMEAVLWASDVLVDRNYISDHLSYALGASAPSSEEAKRIVNAAWSSVSCGMTPGLLRTLMAAMLNIPVIQHDHERVMEIFQGADESGGDAFTAVRTDKGMYKVSPRARLRKCVRIGAELSAGDLLDESIRVYPFLNSSKSEDDCGFSVPMRQDIPSIVVPRSMIRARTEHGIYAMWGESEIKQDAARPLDANCNPRLYFDIGGDPDDVRRFWEDVWADAERRGISMERLLGGTVSPAEFFVKNLVGANTLFVVVDMSQVDDASMMHDPMFFDMLYDVVPSAIRLFLVEHIPVGDEDVVAMDGMGDSSSLSAAVPGVADVSEAPCDSVSIRFFRPGPDRTRGEKQEDET